MREPELAEGVGIIELKLHEGEPKPATPRVITGSASGGARSTRGRCTSRGRTCHRRLCRSRWRSSPKTVVVSRKGELIVWNAIFGQVALDYRFAPELCWPRSDNQKGAVENLVGWVKGSFFKCRRFHDRADLEAQLAQWLLEVNTRRPSRATGIIPSVRLEQERLRLRPLPISPAAYALKIPVVVSARAHVAYVGMTYSMPPETIGQPATLHLYRDRPDAANVLFHAVNERYLHHRPMIFTTNKPLAAWGRVLHDPDLVQAILDRVLERGRHLELRGPSYRTRHMKLDLNQQPESSSSAPARISGNHRPHFPEPTEVDQPQD